MQTRQQAIELVMSAMTGPVWSRRWLHKYTDGEFFLADSCYVVVPAGGRQVHHASWRIAQHFGDAADMPAIAEMILNELDDMIDDQQTSY